LMAWGITWLMFHDYMLDTGQRVPWEELSIRDRMSESRPWQNFDSF
jgi:hypothetical protein